MATMKETVLLANVVLMTQTDLIKVKTIKKKFVDQMEFVSPEELKAQDEQWGILGKTDGYIIFQHVSGRVCKLGSGCFKDYMLNVDILPTVDDLTRAYKMADDKMKAIPQLFAD